METDRCPGCQGQLLSVNGGLDSAGAHLQCANCKESFPVFERIPRLLLSNLREALLGNGAARGIDVQQVRTALSFGFEWQRFPEMYEEWNRSS